MKRLSPDQLAELPADVVRPAYERSATRVGIVHLGVGAFHRAHQAVYVDDRLAAGETDWAICGASLRAADTSDALNPQRGLYTLAVRSGRDERLRVIGALRRILLAPRNPEALIEAMSDPAVCIVSLTVTEKGYCHDPATGALREDHPDIKADLSHPREPRTAPGFLAEALRRRREARTPPFTVLCCDNLPSNGKTVARVVARYAALLDADLARFVENEVVFPSTMVDRIVPATTDSDRTAISRRLGLEDAWPVVTEPFTQWVIEDRFGTGRPRLEDAGADLVADVAPYELMKLRLLNGSHSTLAYLGYLAGYETVSDVMRDDDFAVFMRDMMDREIAPTLAVPVGADLDGYKRLLLARFANPTLHHRTWQIAMDGSQKLPQRLLATIRDRLREAAPIAHLAVGVAAWMRYVTGIDEHGRTIDVRDPMSRELKALADQAGPVAARLAPALLGVGAIFGDLPRDPRFVSAVADALAQIFDKGVRRTVADVNCARA